MDTNLNLQKRSCFGKGLGYKFIKRRISKIISFLLSTRRDCRSGIKITVRMIIPSGRKIIINSNTRQIESRETNPIVYSCVIRFSDAHEYLCGGVKSIVPLEIVKGETSHYRQIHGYYFATASPSVHATVGITRSAYYRIIKPSAKLVVSNEVGFMSQ